MRALILAMLLSGCALESAGESRTPVINVEVDEMRECDVLNPQCAEDEVCVRHLEPAPEVIACAKDAEKAQSCECITNAVGKGGATVWICVDAWVCEEAT
jgi:hypothetical protein